MNLEHRQGHRVNTVEIDWIRSRRKMIQDRGRPNRLRHRPLESGKARTGGHVTVRGQVQSVIVRPNLIFQMTKHRNRRKN